MLECWGLIMATLVTVGWRRGVCLPPSRSSIAHVERRLEAISSLSQSSLKSESNRAPKIMHCRVGVDHPGPGRGRVRAMRVRVGAGG